VSALNPNRPERAVGGAYATISNPHQQSGEEGGESSGPCNNEILYFLCLVAFLCFGGIGLSLYVVENVKEDRLSYSFLTVLGLGSFGIGWCLYVAWLPFGLPTQWLPAQWNPCRKSQRAQHPKHGVNVSQKVLTGEYFSYYTNYMANVLSMDKQVAVIGGLAEGSSIRSIERVTGIHRDTIMRLGVRIGQGCTALMDARMRNLPCTRIEMDEIWGFVGKKERHLRPGDDPQQCGSIWTFCAIDADTKLVPAFRVATDRERGTTTAFVLDVADRMRNRLQISTDGLRSYVDAIDWAFSGKVDYGQIVKTYGAEESIEAQRRYSAPKITAVEKKAIYGRPNFDLISTSYVERLNGTTRTHMKRLARLTYAFSKKRENFEAAVGLHFAYYNFVRRHSTLRCTPAMAAGVEQSFWSVGDLVEAAA